MDVIKLKAQRSGHRGFITKILRKISEIEDENGKAEMIKVLEEKWYTLEKINSQILQELEKEEEIQLEIEDSDEYMLDLRLKLAELTKNGKASENLNQCISRNLNVNAPQFIPSNESLEPNIGKPNIHNHKLPKLNLPVFSGDLLQWQTFWDCFETSIHGNNSLSNVEKFSYLRSLLCGEALRSVSGFSLTNTNYRQAIDVSFERYGQNHKIINAHIQSLIDLPLPKPSPASLRNFLDKMECCIRGLEALGTDENTYGTILTPMIYNKLPAEIRKNITRDKGDDQWELHSLRRAIKKELCVQDTGQSLQPKQETQEFIPTANNFVT
ncbi:uncharacterized protein LOC134244699 [Saccostrea cucullata]|uniref:uncharacterized protein LOC134244699 n=1 Tax=Saccostrea cuccullata TaxID=36930 RepID=UPI002ED69E2D